MSAWVAPHAPAQPDLPDHLDDREGLAFSDEETVAEVEVREEMQPEQQAKGVSLRTVRLIDVDRSGSSLERLDLTSVELRSCNLANVRAPRANAARVLIDRGRLTGVQLNEGLLRDITRRDCRVDLVTFGSSRLERLTFEVCMVMHTDFLDAKLDSVRFHRCDLTGAAFRGARLKRCEFRASELSDIQGAGSLPGSAMPWSDVVAWAGVWATALGIDILDG